ncbi:MAG: type IV pilus modification PilV family protein [Aridibacter sp.]
MEGIKAENINVARANCEKGFTLVEVIIAGIIMIILSIGLLTVFSYTVKINRGENLRTQALSVLQLEVENYRSLKFVPVGSSTQLNSGNYPNLKTSTSADGRVFNISVTIVNLPSGTTDANTTYKEIKITAVPQIAETGWLANLKTDVTVQRVRAN